MPTEKISVPDYDTDSLDEVYSTYRDVTNMSATALREWRDTNDFEAYVDHQDESGDARGAVDRNIRLQERSREDWTDNDRGDAVTAISYIARHSSQDSSTTILGTDITKNLAGLWSWAHDPDGRFATRELKTNASAVATVHKTRLTQPRTPSYSGTTPASERQWPEGGPSLQDYIDGYATDSEKEDASSVGDLSSETRSAIAQSSQLGDPSATSMEDLVVFPNVFPDTKALSEDALDSTLSTLGLASISEETRDRVKSKTHTLLEDGFGREIENQRMNPTDIEIVVVDTDNGLQAKMAKSVDADYAEAYTLFRRLEDINDSLQILPSDANLDDAALESMADTFQTALRELAAYDDLSEGDYVRWGSRGGTVYGRIRGLYDEGEDVPESAYEGDAGRSEGPAAVVALYDQDSDGEWFAQTGDQDGEKRTSHAPDALTVIDSLPESKSLADAHERGYQYREKNVQFRAADPEKRIVYGAVLLPNRVDFHGDFFRPDTVKTLSHDFLAAVSDPDAEPGGPIPGLESAGAGGVLHAVFPGDHLTLVENTILPEDMEIGEGDLAREFPEGTWVQAWRIDNDALAELVFEDRAFTGYSIGMWVTDTTTHDGDALPEGVTVPDAVRDRFDDYEAEVAEMKVGEVRAGSAHEVSLVDMPAVPEALHVAHKTAMGDGWMVDPAESFGQPESGARVLAKAAGALTESHQSAVSYLRERGHSEPVADKIASYLQSVIDGSDLDPDSDEIDVSGEKAGVLSRLKFWSRSNDDEDDQLAVPLSDIEPRSVGGLRTVKSDPLPLGDLLENAGRTLNQRNRDAAMAMHDLALMILDSDALTGGRMPFHSDPEYDYETDVAALLESESGSPTTDTERAMANQSPADTDPSDSSEWFDDLFDGPDTGPDNENEESSQGLPVPADD